MDDFCDIKEFKVSPKNDYSELAVLLAKEALASKSDEQLIFLQTLALVLKLKHGGNKNKGAASTGYPREFGRDYPF
jgi:hypothetical protein